jgi:hypothetical protein
MRIVQQCSVLGGQHPDCSEATKNRGGEMCYIDKARTKKERNLKSNEEESREEFSEVQSQLKSLQAMQEERKRVVTRSMHYHAGMRWIDS